MIVKNAGYAFNKQVFLDGDYEEKSKELTDVLPTLRLENSISASLSMPTTTHGTTLRKSCSFELETIWPGLMVGLGYGHRTGESVNEFKNGFFFDFTTGLPVIPGSTVKGILRSFFPKRYKTEKLKKVVVSRFNELYNEVFEKKEWKLDELSRLEGLIFEGSEGGNRVCNSYEQDVFFDAFPSSTPNNQAYLGEDVITPHDHPLKDPVPLRHLKIMPQVKIKFQFELNERGMTSDKKEKLFEHILRKNGAGAKTSVGFGQFKENATEIQNNQDWYLSDWANTETEAQTTLESTRQQTINELDNMDELPEYKGKLLQQKTTFTAVVVDESKKLVRFKENGSEHTLPITGNCTANGTFVLVKLNHYNKKSGQMQLGFAGTSESNYNK